MKHLQIFGYLLLSTLLGSGLAQAQDAQELSSWHYSPDLLLRLAGNAAQAGWPKMPLSVGEKKQIASVVASLVIDLEPQQTGGTALVNAVKKATRRAALQSGSTIPAAGVAQNAVNAALHAITTYKQPVKPVTPAAKPKTMIESSAPSTTAQPTTSGDITPKQKAQQDASQQPAVDRTDATTTAKTNASNLGHLLLQPTIAWYQNQCTVSRTTANNQNISPWCQGMKNLLAYQTEIDGGVFSTVGYAIWQKVYGGKKLLPLFTIRSIPDNTYFESILSKTQLNPELFQPIFKALTQANLPARIDALALPALDKANVAMAAFAAWTFAAIAFPNAQQHDLRQQLAQQALLTLPGRLIGLSTQDIQKF